MPPKPNIASGYNHQQSELVRATCLYVATKLGDLMDSIVIIGGLAPSLLIDQVNRSAGVDQHCGTMDLDIGLSATVLDEKLYLEIADRLRGAGFKLATNDAGNPTRQMWEVATDGIPVTVDFLIQPTLPTDKGGRLRNLEPDFAAIIAPGLHLAFIDQRRILVTGKTILGEDASRWVQVAGPGAFTVLKALAFRSRGENKDAFDLFYVVRNFGSGIEEVAASLAALLDDDDARRAVTILRDDFLQANAIGPRRVAQFLYARSDESTQADVVGVIERLLSLLPAQT